MAVSGRSIEISYVEEVTQNVTPASNLQIFKNTGDTLNRISNTVNSEIVDNNRNIEDRRQVSNGASGGIDTELFLKNNASFEESALFAKAVDISDSLPGNVTPTATGNKYVTDGDFTTNSDLKPGVSIKFTGQFVNAANNGVKVIKSVTATDLVVFGREALVDEAAVATPAFTGSRIENGNTQITYSIEKKIIGDPTSYYRAFTGMMVNSLSYDIPTRDKVSCSFDFLGYQADNPSSTIGTGYTAKSDDEMIDSSHNLVVFFDGVQKTYTSMNLNIANNLREQGVIGSEALGGIGDGVQDVTATTGLYFENDDDFNLMKNNTEFMLTLMFKDDDGNEKVVSLPHAKYLDPDEPNGGNDSDFVENFTIGAMKHPTAGYQISIDNHFV